MVAGDAWAACFWRRTATSACRQTHHPYPNPQGWAPPIRTSGSPLKKRWVSIPICEKVGLLSSGNSHWLVHKHSQHERLSRAIDKRGLCVGASLDVAAVGDACACRNRTKEQWALAALLHSTQELLALHRRDRPWVEGAEHVPPCVQ